MLAACNGLRRLNRTFEVITEVPKTQPKVSTADINISTTGAPSKMGVYFKRAQAKKQKFLILDTGEFGHEGEISIARREEFRTATQPIQETPLFCNFFDSDYVKHKYIRGRAALRSDLLANVEIKPWRENKDDDYILVFEQIRPEGSNLKIIDRGYWEKWLGDLVKFIKPHSNLPIVIREHPNRKAWPDIKKQSLDGKYTILKNTKLGDDLLRARCTITVSSRGIMRALLDGVPSYSMNKNAAYWDLITPQIKDVINNPIKADRHQWLKDISYSYWTLAEIENGDYFDYMFKELI